MITEGKAANAIGGKTARACDSCLKKRARWFCSADDAFLCQSCDTLVHSANQLASRHERVRLESSSSAFRARTKPAGDREHVPKWHRGFTRKARTPRNHAKSTKLNNSSSHSLVPEISGDDDASPFDQNESDEQIRVPVFEPFSHAELCNELNHILNNDEVPEFINASDAELADFAADVESLLGTKIDDGGVYGMEAMGFEGERKEEEYQLVGSCLDEVWNMEEKSRVKIEDDDQDDHEEVEAVIACHFDPALDMAKESLSWDDHFHFSMSPLRPHGEEEETEEVKVVNHDCSVPMKMDNHESSNVREEKKMVFLKLSYETVITTWGSQGSPWADGIKPEFDTVDCWPEFLSTSPRDVHENPLGAGGGRFVGGRDEEREARVMRYREKRRTRLFSKKIRYEVRKLNAEKRPRMKGRFVKRTSFAAQQSFPNNFRTK